MPDLADVPVVVLCGGFGMRLRSVVQNRPKVLAPIAGRPFLDYLLLFLAREGVRDVILSTGYLGEMVQDFAGDGTAWGVCVRYAEEPAPLGTGGALRFAARQHGLDRPFLAMNGDTFFGGSLAVLAATHPAGAAATLALARVPEAHRYGTVHFDAATRQVTRFAEKAAAARGPAWINAGVYLIAPALLEDVPADRKVSLERDVFPHHVGAGLYACPFADAAFLDIGTPEDYTRAPEVLATFTGT